MKWAAVVQSALGFTWCFSIAFLFAGFHIQPAPDAGQDPYITQVMVENGLQLAYVLVIPGIILSGAVIWAHSVAEAYRRRDFASVATAGWNTYAQASNMASAAENLPDAFDTVGELFSGDNKGSGLVIALVIFALVGGVFTTYGIVTSARREVRRKQKFGY